MPKTRDKQQPTPKQGDPQRLINILIAQRNNAQNQAALLQAAYEQLQAEHAECSQPVEEDEKVGGTD